MTFRSVCDPEASFAGQMASGPSRTTGRNVLHQTGRIKWFSPAKHFGFIISNHTNEEIFFHQSNVRDIPCERLTANLPVCFLVRITPKGQEAYNVQPDGSLHYSTPATFQWPQRAGQEMGRQKTLMKTKRSCRCYNCGQYASHKAAFCPMEPLRKCCYRCRSSSHLVAQCPLQQPIFPQPFTATRMPPPTPAPAPSHMRPMPGSSPLLPSEREQRRPDQSKSVLSRL